MTTCSGIANKREKTGWCRIKTKKHYRVVATLVGWIGGNFVYSQEHISLIILMFCFNELAFTVKSNTIQIVHKFLALFWYVCILRLAISTHVYFAKNVAYFSSLIILGSVFSDCVVYMYYGDIIFILWTAIMFQITLWFLSLPGTCAYSGLQDVGNRHDV